ncbi:unnamed protein product [marine sediment metagenome]|uniref:Uncharacterized protein n=1 Tax=marine sediment metagenome TaxID=412755 RepID=X1U5R8_9ZZZZ
MAEFTLISPRKRQLKPLVEAALHPVLVIQDKCNELRLLEVGIRRTEQKLQGFETRYGLPSTEFVRRYEQDRLEETLEFAEWIGEYRLLEPLLEKADALRELR